MKTAAIAAGVFAVSVAAVSPTTEKRASLQAVTVKGNAFFQGDKRFYIRGIDYQPGGSSLLKDPIADVATCKRDVAKFKELGINTVRVYSIDNTAEHDECMNLLADAGIYLALDVNTPKYSINRANPQQSYNAVYLQSIFATVEKFSKYTNTLLFFSGNEVINTPETSNCAPYIKATTRDIKSYLNARKLRAIPVGYAAADVSENRWETADYMNCGPDAARSDFFAFNDYSWCDPSTFEGSGWNQKVDHLKDYSIPIFLGEFGCNKGKRQFNEIAAMYSDKMTGVYSGGLVYEYSQEEQNYGLVQINGDSVSELDDFKVLKAAYAKTPAPTGDGGYKKDGKASECPSEGKNWNVTISSDQLPAFPKDAQKLLKDGAGPGPGFQGAGSQTAGSPSSNLADAADGAVTSGASTDTSSGSTPSDSKGAAAALRPGEFSMAPLVCGAIVLVSSLMGGALIL